MRARSYALVRFGLKGATEVRGDFVLNNTCVSSEESALLPLLSRGDARFCLLCQALSKFFGIVPIPSSTERRCLVVWRYFSQTCRLRPLVSLPLGFDRLPDDSSVEVLDVNLGEEVEIVDLNHSAIFCVSCIVDRG